MIRKIEIQSTSGEKHLTIVSSSRSSNYLFVVNDELNFEIGRHELIKFLVGEDGIDKLRRCTPGRRPRELTEYEKIQIKTMRYGAIKYSINEIASRLEINNRLVMAEVRRLKKEEQKGNL